MPTIEEVAREQAAILDKMSKSAGKIGVITALLPEGKAFVNAQGTVWEINQNFGVKPGDTVVLHDESRQIMRRAAGFAPGNVVVARSPAKDGMVEVDERYVFCGCEVQPGDRLLLDISNSTVVRNLGPGTDAYNVDHSVSVLWDEIGGLETAKQELREGIELPFKHPDIYKAFGQKPPKGFLLYGPPGCGKTMLGKAAATALADDGSGSFLYVKAPEILSKYVGEAESRVRQVFGAAKAFKARTGKPALIFLDEADALLQRRGTGISSDMEKTIVPSFLTEMDGLGDSAAIVVLATNRADTLDPAVLRDGRIDRKIRVGRPDKKSAKDIFRLNIGKVEAEDGVEEKGVDALFGKLLGSVNTDRGAIEVGMGDLVNGAMIAGVVQRAKMCGIRRAIKEGCKRHLLTVDDVLTGVEEAYRETKRLDHSAEIKAVLDEAGLVWLDQKKEQRGSIYEAVA